MERRSLSKILTATPLCVCLFMCMYVHVCMYVMKAVVEVMEVAKVMEVMAGSPVMALLSLCNLYVSYLLAKKLTHPALST